MSLRLVRLETGSTETIGVLKLNGLIQCYILEPPKFGNKINKSCIPTGRYYCEKYYSKKYKTDCLALTHVPGRKYIAIHYGNTAKDTTGCLLAGLHAGKLNGKRAVLQSRDALRYLMNRIRDETYLTIVEEF